MKCTPQKRKFLQSKVKYAGHIVSANKSELDSFLEFAGYYRQFIKEYSKFAKPLHDLSGNQCNKKKLKQRRQKG